MDKTKIRRFAFSILSCTVFLSTVCVCVCVCVRNRHWLEHNVLTPFKLCVCEGNFVLLCTCVSSHVVVLCVCV